MRSPVSFVLSWCRPVPVPPRSEDRPPLRVLLRQPDGGTIAHCLQLIDVFLLITGFFVRVIIVIFVAAADNASTYVSSGARFDCCCEECFELEQVAAQL